MDYRSNTPKLQSQQIYHQMTTPSPPSRGQPLCAGAQARIQALKEEMATLEDAPGLRELYSRIIRDYETGKIVWQRGAGYVYDTGTYACLGRHNEMLSEVLRNPSTWTEFCSDEPIVQFMNEQRAKGDSGSRRRSR
ncbi:uncharacterized protein DFL_002799 [Arthrobotrys flagrans]|uniref:Uncharacterized protein n=1 Tax=Arthrobotrys flagrans TaxID=97331 RepID=A0A437ABU5_ARTFL|nr:hypothetical protein DFL_002799 [Arthrobotrys flagrans]